MIITLSCAGIPPPRTVYQDYAMAVRIQADGKSGQGHSHPAKVNSETIRYVLDRVRIQSRKSLVPSILTGDPPLVHAFSRDELTSLAPHLSRALGEAGPHELVTFYLRSSNAALGLAITSGGLFVHDRHLYVMLANDRTLPSDGMDQSIVSEIDPIDNPLLPISRTSFRATFEPPTSLVPEDERWAWPYIDRGRILVLDLVRIAQELRQSGSGSQP